MRCAKCVLAVIFIVIGIGVAIWTIYNMSHIPESFPLVEYSEVRKEAMKLKVESASTYFSSAIVLLGFLWVVFFVEKEKLVKLGDTPAVLMFIMANIFLGLSIYFHIEWKEKVIRSLWDLPLKGSKVPNLFYKYFNEISWAQTICFFFAVIITGLLLVSAKFSTNGGRGCK